MVKLNYDMNEKYNAKNRGKRGEGVRREGTMGTGRAEARSENGESVKGWGAQRKGDSMKINE